MVKSSKKNNKSELKKHKKSSKQMKQQKGGVSNACVLPYTNSNLNFRGSGSISVADAHNLNPQASYDLLDNTNMLYGEKVPLGQTGGNSSKTHNTCGDEGGHTNTIKNTTFKQYLQNLDSQFSLTGGNYGGHNNNNNNNNTNTNNTNNNNNNNNNDKQKGSGYIVDPSQMIAGKPVYAGYPDNNSPAIIDGKILMGDPDKSVCGNGANKGGSRKSRKSRKSRNKSRKSRNSRKSRKSKNNSVSNNNSNNSNSNNNSDKLLIGGNSDFVSIGSKPELYADAFKGPPGVFKYPDDMKTRDFGETQPNYSPNAI
jgi:hypothetical protein